MKKFFTSIAMLALAFGSMYGEILTPVSIDNSGCLGTRSNDFYSDDDIDDEINENKWNLQYKDGLLTVVWQNFVANCCPDGFTTWIELADNSNIVFYAKENNSLCDCICSFDVTSSYENVKPGHYSISFRNASYSDAGLEVFAAEVDITEGCDIILTKAPSGVHAISTDTPVVTVSPEGLIHIASSEAASLEIYDAGGTLCTRLNATPNSDIDITNLRKGVYIAKITIAGKVSTLRFAR